jgi:AcrR family transcriptional regulator
MFTTVQASRALHRENLRAGILKAARKIFVRDGFNAFSMRTLAGAVGYSPAALYLHFKNKEDLFDALVEESFRHLNESLAKLQEKTTSSPADSLKRGFRLYVEWGLQHPNEYQIAFVVRNPRKKQYRTHQAFAFARRLVENALKDSRVTKRNVELRTRALWAATHGITSLLIQRPNFPWISEKEVIDQVIENAVSGAVRRSNSKKPGSKHAGYH